MLLDHLVTNPRLTRILLLPLPVQSECKHLESLLRGFSNFASMCTRHLNRGKLLADDHEVRNVSHVVPGAINPGPTSAHKEISLFGLMLEHRSSVHGVVKRQHLLARFNLTEQRERTLILW